MIILENRKFALFIQRMSTVILIILAIILSLVGLVGAIVPGIAGPPFSFLGLLTLSFVKGIDYSVGFLVVMGVLAVGIFVLDYLVPIWGTKVMGGSKAGTRGSTIGLIIGLLVTLIFPIGFIAVLLGPFLGAYIGEKSAGAVDPLAWRAALGSFLGFLTGTIFKTVYALVCVIITIKDLIDLI